MTKYIHARVYPGRDDDLIAWLEELPPGERSSAIREALRIGIGLLSPTDPHEAADIGAIVRQAVIEAIEGLQLVAAQSMEASGTDEAEEIYGEKLDKMLNSLEHQS